MTLQCISCNKTITFDETNPINKELLDREAFVISVTKIDDNKTLCNHCFEHNLWYQQGIQEYTNMILERIVNDLHNTN